MLFMKKLTTRTDLADLTFIIPVRIESIERLENLQAATDYLLKHFRTRIFVLEAASRNNGFLKKCLSPEIEIFFVEDNDAIFHRTKYLNILTRKVFTPFIAVWDSDVLVAQDQIIAALDSLKQNTVDFIFPYDGMFLDTGPENRNNFLRSGNLPLLESKISTMFPLYGYHASGGGFMANCTAYREVGMENENFYGWGPEDGERVKRWDILELKANRVKGPMFHLSHPRGVNSGARTEEALKEGIEEYLRICRMSKEELQNEILLWHKDHFMEAQKQ